MKSIVTSLAAVVLSLSSFAQVDVELNIHHLFGDQWLVSGTTYNAPDGYPVSVTRMEYYLSSIELVHDGGQTTALDSTWLLVDAWLPESYDLGEHNITTLESIRFSIGIDTAFNHLDPAIWPNHHPLAPQNPSMHWGWAAGYQFLVFEGEAGQANNFYEVHVLGDANYFSVELPTAGTLDNNTLTIDLQADYSGLLNSLDLSPGVIAHTETGIAGPVLSDMATPNRVFSPGVPVVSVPELVAGRDVQLYPNPSGGATSVLQLNNAAGNVKAVELYNEIGKLVWSTQTEPNSSIVELPKVAAGTYFVTVLGTGTPLTQKWIVTE